MAAVNYGAVAIVPKGDYDSTAQYSVGSLVSYDGSSYIAHTEPPAGTIPTNTGYWQVAAAGTAAMTADTLGTGKPDGVTVSVSGEGTISATCVEADGEIEDGD